MTLLQSGATAFVAALLLGTAVLLVLGLCRMVGKD